jgi:hypothetical protein
MPDPMRNKLGAYLDGELDWRGQSQVQAHLETCQACRAELEELRRLSYLLRSAAQPDFTPALDFRAQLMLQLPRRTDAPVQHRNGGWLPWLAPALVLAGWVFVQVTLALSTLVSFASQTGFLGGALAWASSDPQQIQWIAFTRATLGGMLGQGEQTGLEALNSFGLFAQNTLILLILQVGMAALYCGALIVLWHKKVKPLWTSLTSE